MQSSERKTTRSRDQSFQARCIKLSGASASQWARVGAKRGAELQKREQELGYAQALAQQLQQQGGVEMDSLVSGVKFIH
jgi:hypothetical protein